MFKVIEIKEKLWIEEYLKDRFIYEQYIKAKLNILSWNYAKHNFKEKNPKWSLVYYFRINKQYRAIWFIENSILRIIKIDNHQNK